MKRYVAFLRGVSPMNAKMPELKRCFESAGYKNVKTVLSSGNVVFDARPAPNATLERAVESAMEKALGRTFYTVVRPAEELLALLAEEPFAGFKLPPEAKRVVSFVRQPPATRLALPITEDGAQILKVQGCEIFTAYVPNPSGPVFMVLLERMFGKDITTRTWGTVQKCAAA